MLYKEILTQALSSTILKDENLQAIAAQLIHDTCCQAVLEIQAILADDTRTDKDCFYQIEKIAGQGNFLRKPPRLWLKKQNPLEQSNRTARKNTRFGATHLIKKGLYPFLMKCCLLKKNTS